MHVLVHLTWLYDIGLIDQVPSNYMEVDHIDRSLKVVCCKCKDRLLEVPFDAIWNVEELFQ